MEIVGVGLDGAEAPAEAERKAVEAEIEPHREYRRKQNQWARQTGYLAETGPLLLQIYDNYYWVAGPDLRCWVRMTTTREEAAKAPSMKEMAREEVNKLMEEWNRITTGLPSGRFDVEPMELWTILNQMVGAQIMLLRAIEEVAAK
jgi:hypothetical protein